MEKLIQQVNQARERILAQLASEYLNRNSHVSDAQIARFKGAMHRQLLNTGRACFSVLEAGCEVEETNRLFADDLAWLES
ncbi:hypothetical protein [Kluyvera sp. CHPC 1.2972]|uniref:hypothetical protein n=1 Tax=Kluyvera sp. CHPC 1.2972 TaxID=2995176 RepID=UPI002FD82B93